jgi:hypothetical protein
VGLGFLKADHIGVLFGQPAEKALAGGGTDAVGVEGDDPHEAMMLRWQGGEARYDTDYSVSSKPESRTANPDRQLHDSSQPESAPRQNR